MTTRYWIGVVSEEHVVKGTMEGFAQVCHGKAAPLRRMKSGDWLIYYSPRTSYPNGNLLQAFTAIGKVKTGEVYPFQMTPNFIPYRVDIDYLDCIKVSYSSIKSSLYFVQNNPSVGLLMRRGHFEINRDDFLTIATCMGVLRSELEI